MRRRIAHRQHCARRRLPRLPVAMRRACGRRFDTTELTEENGNVVHAAHLFWWLVYVREENAQTESVPDRRRTVRSAAQRVHGHRAALSADDHTSRERCGT